MPPVFAGIGPLVLFRLQDKEVHSSDLPSNLPGRTLTVNALTACSECKACGTINKLGDKS